MPEELKIATDAYDKLTAGMASIKDVKELVNVILTAIKEMKKNLEADITEGKKEALEMCNSVIDDVDKAQKNLVKIVAQAEGNMNRLYSDYEKGTAKKFADILIKIQNIQKDIPEMPNMEEYVRKIEDIKELIPTIKEIKKEVMPDIDKKLRDLYENLKEYVDGRPKTEVVSRPMTFGGRVGFQVFDDSSKVGGKINEISFGSGLAVTIVNGRLTVSSTGGGTGYTKAIPAGALGQTSFTVTNEPVYVIADGTTYFDGAGYTYSAGTITMDNAPTQYIRYFY
ncbi:MAG: hypothetical protein V4469_04345 [Patescibacteria group bacterium]